MLTGYVTPWGVEVRISVLCTDTKHPVVKRLEAWTDEMRSRGHQTSLCFDKRDLVGGDVLFLVSCSQILRDLERKKFSTTLVLHASDLPRGRGWSPHIWSILHGSNDITVSLLEADEPVDSGAVWLKSRFLLEGHELLTEINDRLFTAELALMTKAIEQFGQIAPLKQTGDPGQYLQKRSPEDSRIDPNKTIAEQFDLLRVVDSDRYPAFFDFRGKRYLIKIEKSGND